MLRSITHDTLLTQSVGPTDLAACRSWGMGRSPMERSATVFGIARFELVPGALAIYLSKQGARCVPCKTRLNRVKLAFLFTYSKAVWHLFRCHRASVARLRLPSASLTPP